MSESSDHDHAEIQDGLVQLRFADSAGNVSDISAAEMAESLQGLVEYTSKLAKNGMFGEGLYPEVRIRPVQQGSVIIEAVLQWSGENPEAWNATLMSAGALLTQGFNLGLKKLRGEKCKAFQHLDNGNVSVTWSNDTAQEIPKKVWYSLQKMDKQTKRSLRKIMSPLGDDVETMEMREAATDAATAQIMSQPADLTVSREDYRIAATEVDDISTGDRDFEIEAQFESVTYRPGEKWIIKSLEGRRKVTITDDEFLKSLDLEFVLHKNDIFRVNVHEIRTTKNGRTTREWELTKVVRVRRGGGHGSDSSGEGSDED